MQKNSKIQNSDLKKKPVPIKSPNQKNSEGKLKTPFDHISQIREIKDPNYYINLSEQDKKNFNRYIIVMGLSMDPDIIDDLAYVSKYFDVMPDNQFYRVCCDVVPKGRRYVKWIKGNKPKHNIKLIEIVVAHYKISKREAYQYCDIYMNTDEGISMLIDICAKHGLSDDEIEPLFEEAAKNETK